MGVHRVDGLHLRELGLQLLIQRYAGGRAHQVVDLGPRHTKIEGLENRLAAVGNLIDTHHRHITATRVVAGKFAERAFNFALAAFNHPFEDHL